MTTHATMKERGKPLDTPLSASKIQLFRSKTKSELHTKAFCTLAVHTLASPYPPIMLHHAVHLMGLLPFTTRAVYVGLGFPPHQRYITSSTPQTNISSETLKMLWKGGLHGQRRRANCTNEKDLHSRKTKPLQGAKRHPCMHSITNPCMGITANAC